MSPRDFFAHTKSDQNGTTLPQSEWEPLFTPFSETSDEACERMDPQAGHLNKVAHWTARFAAEMFPPGPDRDLADQWGYLAGLWHDLGKFAPEWQNYLKTKSDPHAAEVTGKVDHTTAGAKHAVSVSRHCHLIATAITGHHAGLLDARAEGASLENRLRKTFGNEIPHLQAPTEVTEPSIPSLPGFLTNLPKGKHSDFSLSFFQRLLFSCLVDADFLATEAFMNPSQAAERPVTEQNLFNKALTPLEKKIADFGAPAETDKVACARATVVNDCTRAASHSPGIFTLTVPTGGGKTLSSLNFALRHALAHGKRRIIYVIPFTSIIEQNASVFRELLAPHSLGNDILIEHHSNLAPDTEKNQTETSRLAAENWDAPIVITTAVQFYESLYAAKTSRSRKLHNIANSVVILDEAQCLPVQYLEPCLRVLRELSANYHTTIVLCTATQPAVAASEDFRIGFPDSTEIIQDTTKLFSDLDRVTVTYRGSLDDTTIARELAAVPQALCIVNTRSHARNLFESLPGAPGENYHLSTLMCPQHRLKVLATIRQRLNDKLPVRLISTQLIEAGVDVDFPVVFRSMAGLDSIVQASGRCNREGKLPTGQTHIFHSKHIKSERYFEDTAGFGYEFLKLYSSDPLGTEAVRSYFNKYYHQQKSQWDAKHILDDFKFSGSSELPFLFNYRTAADKFRLIESNQIPIIIPLNDEAKALCKDLRNESESLHRKLLRALQRYTVQIYESDFTKNLHQFESHRDDQFHILTCPETHYSGQFGLDLTGEGPNSNLLICET